MANKKNDTFRTNIMNEFRDMLVENMGEDCLTIGSNKYAIPFVDEDGNEKWLTVTFTVPKGTRDGDEFDGYSMQEEYEMKCKEKAERAKKAAEEKAKKIAKAKAEREAKAKAKEQSGE